MGCVDSVDVELGTLSVMVAGGVFGGIASRNAALPRLAMAKIALGVLPIGVSALLSPRHGASILLPPLVAIYLAERQEERHAPGCRRTLTDGPGRPRSRAGSLRGQPRCVRESAFHPRNVPASFPMSRYMFRNVDAVKSRNSMKMTERSAKKA